MRLVLLLISVPSLAFAPAPSYRSLPGEENLRPMEGRRAIEDWRKLVPDGMPARKGQKRGGDAIHINRAIWYGTSVEVIGKRVVFRLSREAKSEWSLTAKLDTPGVSHHAVDISDSIHNRTILGIFKVEGDALTICFREPGQGRPQEFSNHRQWLLVLKQKKS